MLHNVASKAASSSLFAQFALSSVASAPGGTFADDAERLSGRIAASLDFAGAFDLVREGPRAFSARLASELDALGGTISTTYFPAIPVG